jgi:hypothetical protein
MSHHFCPPISTGIYSQYQGVVPQSSAAAPNCVLVGRSFLRPSSYSSCCFVTSSRRATWKIYVGSYTIGHATPETDPVASSTILDMEPPGQDWPQQAAVTRELVFIQPADDGYDGSEQFARLVRISPSFCCRRPGILAMFHRFVFHYARKFRRF